MNPKMWWFASRASGMVLWLVLAATLCWGLAVSSRLVRRRGMPAWMLDLHKHLATLAIVFTGVHLLSLWADNFVHFGFGELFIPMASGWKRGPVAWGVVAFYLLVVVEGSSLVMRRIPRQLWHAVHMLSLPMFVTGTVHGIMSGTDWRLAATKWTAIVVASAVVWLATFRVFKDEASTVTDDRLTAARAARTAQRSATLGSLRVAPAASAPMPAWPAPSLSDQASDRAR